MGTPINKNVDIRFEKSTQPLGIFEHANTLEMGVEVLLNLARVHKRS